MGKLIALSLIALVCCVTMTLAYGTMYYPYGGGMTYGGGGFNNIGQGGIMQFFIMIIFLMFMMEIFRGFGGGFGSGGSKESY